MIELQNLTVGYDERAVLSNVNLRFPRGSVTVLLGPNGSGKTTLLKAILGSARILEGSISIEGLSRKDMTSNALARRVSYLPQTRRVPDMTVERLVLHGRFPYLSYPRKYRQEDLDIARQSMARTGILDCAQTQLSRLSGGQRQRAYIAMALAQNTDAILLDEPNAYLDIAHQLQLMELCQNLAADHKAVVLVLHDLNLALEYAHRIAVFGEGRLLIQGDADRVCHSGALETAFGVTVRRMDTPEGSFYRCRMKKEG